MEEFKQTPNDIIFTKIPHGEDRANYISEILPGGRVIYRKIKTVTSEELPIDEWQAPVVEINNSHNLEIQAPTVKSQLGHELSRRSFLKKLLAAATLAFAGEAASTVNELDLFNEELAPIPHTVQPGETLRIIVIKYYPNMRPEEIYEYIYDSGKIVNFTALDDKNRGEYDPDFILPGDYIELSEP